MNLLESFVKVTQPQPHTTQTRGCVLKLKLKQAPNTTQASLTRHQCHKCRLQITSMALDTVKGTLSLRRFPVRRRGWLAKAVHPQLAATHREESNIEGCVKKRKIQRRITHVIGFPSTKVDLRMFPMWLRAAACNAVY
ncbi:hypothetical protein E2C01_015154 [Portunus trituberculatus]|uniref:Uncharacterized protein n=1 Tax=Portunus trituberculatus TaxID=210409 RepID=A0A5B7DLY8_PORTR|nr:hypothetical protein [Portunus trituberculatus]